MRRLLLGRSWPTTRPENPRRALMVSGGDNPDTQITARQSAVKARTHRPQTNSAGSAGVSAPEDLRHRLRELPPTKDLVDTCARFPPRSWS